VIARGRGLGKVILFGEHAVVYGHPALAGAIDRGVTITGQPGRLALEVPAWSLSVEADADADAHAHPVARALRAIGDAVAGLAAPRRAVTADDALALDGFLDRLPIALHGDATVPAGVGLGSSAALAVAITRALAAASDVTLTPDEVVDIANAAEGVFHQRPSGVDVALAAHGGVGLFERGVGLRRVATPPLRLVIGLSGEPRRTRDMVARVATATGERPDDPRLMALGALASAGAHALTRGDLSALGAMMDDAHARLAELGVSTAALDQLATLARSAGALGAKLTGAGGGGAVIALAPGRQAEVTAAWQAAGVATLDVVVGGAA
jgi:mevalonate kinase